MQFCREALLPCSIDKAFAYHERPDALRRMLPPWQNIHVAKAEGGVRTGASVSLVLRQGWFPFHLEAVHEDYEPPTLFADRLVRSPFASWFHQHQFRRDGELSILRDCIEFELPAWSRGLPFLQQMCERQLERMFAWRHHVLQGDLQFQESWPSPRPLRIAISGSSGLIGERVCNLLSVLGHEVIRLVRSRQAEKSDRSLVVLWNPSEGLNDPSLLEGIDGVIHLAGENVASRWTPNQKLRLQQSRIEATRTLAAQLARLQNPPRVFVSASGVGYYGDCGERVVTEADSPGNDFLSDMASRWEAASKPLEEVGTRRCFGRLGIVLHPRLGALGKMIPLFRWCLGGRLGSGNQYWSWIDSDDAASAFVWMIVNEGAQGPYNLCAPESSTNRAFTQQLASVLNRPALFPVPAWGLRAVLGEMADGMLLSSCRAHSQRLEEQGFVFRSPHLHRALALCCGRAYDGK